MGGMFDPIKVSINQFFGIEINDFACSVAQTALWIAESQMMQETDEIVGFNLDPLPLKTYTNIYEGNALRLDWNEVVPAAELNYIMGNPPFIGANNMRAEQKNDAVAIFGKIKLSNSIDYVGAWYHKSCMMMKENTGIKAALVSTNSITQGEQVSPLWQPLFDHYGVHIDFVWRTFQWDSEASLKAHVHCVIIGFSVGACADKTIYTSVGAIKAHNINPYLLDAPNELIVSRGTPLSEVPKMTHGNMPIDGGNLILSEDERSELLKKDPQIEPLIKRFVGAQDFLNNNVIRYCLWLKGVPPSAYAKNRDIMARLEKVREVRLASSAAPTRKAADTPFQFFSSPQTELPYLCVPEVSSGNRTYIPFGFKDNTTIASNKLMIVPDADIYHFGVLQSLLHMAWVRVVCGRMKSDYSYSAAVIYNNFPWPTPTEEQKRKIEETAQLILDTREACKGSTLADLYNPLTMPVELRKTHRANDAAVLEAYGFPKDASESEIVARLFKMYQELKKAADAVEK